MRDERQLMKMMMIRRAARFSLRQLSAMILCRCIDERQPLSAERASDTMAMPSELFAHDVDGDTMSSIDAQPPPAAVSGARRRCLRTLPSDEAPRAVYATKKSAR